MAMSTLPPGPWTFSAHCYGLTNVIMDADGRHLASNVPASAGLLMAAGPGLLERMARIARLTASGSPANAIAKEVMREFGYRRAALRIIGEAH